VQELGLLSDESLLSGVTVNEVWYHRFYWHDV